MKWFVVLMGVFWIILGISGLLATQRWVIEWGNMLKNTKRRSLGLIILILSVLLLISATSVRETWFVFMLGILGCLKAVTVILMPQKSLKRITDWWLGAPEIIHKWWAAFMLILGVVMFYII